MTLFVASTASAELQVDLYPDTIRVDLSDGRLLRDPDASVAETRGWRFATQPLRIGVARDEVFALQIIGRGEAGAYPIVVEGLEGMHVELFEEVGIRIASPSESGGLRSIGPGFYPDALIPTSTLTVPAMPGVGAVWVDIFVPPDATPGPRVGALQIGDHRIDVELTVLDVVLPTENIARLGSVNFGSLLVKEKRQPGSMLRWMQMARRHHVDIEVLRLTPEQSDDGVIDWAGWMSKVRPYVEGTAYSAAAGYVGPRAGQPVVRWIVPHTDWWPTKATKAGLPDDPARWSKTLRAWEQQVAAAGWFDRPNATQWVMFINSLDEPRTVDQLESLAKYETLLADAQLEDRHRIWFRTDGNFGREYGGLDDEAVANKIGGAVDLWNMHGAYNTAPVKMLHRRQVDHGERAMFYASNSGGEPSIPPLVIDAEIVGARTWAWIVYRYGLYGALNWEVDYFNGGCVANPKCSEGGTMNLDANLIYRGEDFGRATDEPIASMRLKVLRRGAQDVAIASVLSRTEPKVAARIAQILVPSALGDDVPESGRGTWTLDPASYDRARNAMLTALAGGTAIPTSTIRTDGKASPRPTASSYLYGLGVTGLVALMWWWLSRGARRAARDKE